MIFKTSKSSCSNNDGSYECVCNHGWYNVESGAPGLCGDVDECSDGSAECNQYSACSNLQGDYECICNSGFTQTATGHPAECTDLNECEGENDGHNCDDNATCTNEPGTFSCACNDQELGGYVDVDENAEPGTACELKV